MDYSKYRIMYYDSVIIRKNDIIWGLLELGFDVERSEIKVELSHFKEEEVEAIEKEIVNYRFAVSQNFSVNVAEACKRKAIPYISWTYDSPLAALYEKQAFYETNFIFVFDKKQLERLKALGIKNVFYQPLVANMAITSSLNISDDDIKNYGTDIAFVGKIYENNFYETYIKNAPDYVLEDINALYDNVVCKWGKDISPLDYLSDETMEYTYQFLDKSFERDYNISRRFVCEVVLMIPSIAGFERKQLMNLCGENFDTKLYTTTDINMLNDIKNVKIYPPVKYDDEMYKVFYASKINVNLTLRSIETGIPQRVFDIMSVGGPVFSNYQEEIEELFKIDRDIVVFHSLEEFKDKAKWYLAHDNERIRLGINGYYRVRDEYNYKVALAKMFKIVEEMI